MYIRALDKIKKEVLKIYIDNIINLLVILASLHLFSRLSYFNVMGHWILI